jgi:HupE / UreJ protein
MRWLWCFCWAALLAMSLATAAQAHKPSDSYLRLVVGDSPRIEGQWDIALRDLDHAIGLDANGDGELTWGEVRARHVDIAAYALARLKIAVDGKPCAASAGEQLVDDHSDGAYTVLKFTLECAATPRTFEVSYSLFADLDPLHRGLLNLATEGGNQSAVLEPGTPAMRLTVQAPDRLAQFSTYVREGVWHIWIGFDHILFLLSLLLPAVLLWRPALSGANWAPVPRFRAAFIDVLKIVTAFTLAHSITLTLATLRIIELPSALVESTIAASVVLAALNNVWPVFHGRRWMVAFGFGLIHGFGFATVLMELGLPQSALLLALVAFNVGVELGQLAIVAVFLPLAYALRRTLFYRLALLKFGSLVIAGLAAAWFVERAFGVELLTL